MVIWLFASLAAGRLPTGGDTARMRREATLLPDVAALVQSSSKGACPDDLKGALFNHIPKTGGTAYWRMMGGVFLRHLSQGGMEWNGGGHKIVSDDDARAEMFFGHDASLAGGAGAASSAAVADDPALSRRYNYDHSPSLVYQTGASGLGAGKGGFRNSKAASDVLEHAQGAGVITSSHARNYFTFGLLRRPCEFMLSVWNQNLGLHGHKTAQASEHGKAAFKQFVLKSLNASAKLGPTPTMREVYDTNILSDRVKMRYGGEDARHVHCMARMEHMKEDFVACAKRYAGCGGAINASHLASSYLDTTLAVATEDAHSFGRSAGDHASCASMYDDELLHAVSTREAALIRRFDLGSCCAPPKDEAAAAATSATALRDVATTQPGWVPGVPNPVMPRSKPSAPVVVSYQEEEEEEQQQQQQQRRRLLLHEPSSPLQQELLRRFQAVKKTEQQQPQSEPLPPPRLSPERREATASTAATAAAPAASSLRCPRDLHGALFNHIPKTGGTALWAVMHGAFVDEGGGHARVFDDSMQRVLEGLFENASAAASRQPYPEPTMQLVSQNGVAGLDPIHDHTNVGAAKEKAKSDVYAHTQGDGIITARHASAYFTFGLLRRPCDFMLSVWNQDHHYNSGAANQAAFREWVFMSLNASAKLGPNPTMREVYNTNILSDRVKMRYGGEDARHVHCMARMEHMKEDFVACAKRYAGCGGPVTPSHLASSYLDRYLARAHSSARSQGRSDGDHASCGSMFDGDMVEAVMAREKRLIDRFNLGGCC